MCLLWGAAPAADAVVPRRFHPLNLAGRQLRGPYVTRDDLPHNIGRQFFSTFERWMPGSFLWADGTEAFRWGPPPPQLLVAGWGWLGVECQLAGCGLACRMPAACTLGCQQPGCPLHATPFMLPWVHPPTRLPTHPPTHWHCSGDAQGRFNSWLGGDDEGYGFWEGAEDEGGIEGEVEEDEEWDGGLEEGSMGLELGGDGGYSDGVVEEADDGEEWEEGEEAGPGGLGDDNLLYGQQEVEEEEEEGSSGDDGLV